VQVNAYLDNRIDVQTLLTDSEIKVTALEQVAELEDTLAQVYYQFNDSDFFHVVRCHRYHCTVFIRLDLPKLCYSQESHVSFRP